MVFDTGDFTFERYALNLEWDDLPLAVQRRAVMCGVDLTCALLLGSRSRQFENALSMVRRLGMTGPLPVLGAPECGLNLFGSTMALGHASNALDIDDGFNLVKGHPGASFVAGALSAALEADVSYREYLTALVACYEGAIRWALAMQEHYGFLHSTGAYGAFGTALALGKLLGFSERQLKNALSIADYHAPMIPVMRAVEYPSMNKDGVPFGALVGAAAAFETMEGNTGSTHLLECPQYSALLENLGERYYIEELYFKPYTCCRWAHQPITACLELMREHQFSYEEVASVTVHTFDAAAKLYKCAPTSTDEAQYNIAYPVACALVHGDVGYEQVCEDALGDERVLDIMGRLHFVVDDELEALFPEKRLAWVEVSLLDGRVLKSRVTAAPGEADDPALGIDWACDKFRKRTRFMLSSENQAKALELLLGDDCRMRDIVVKINDLLQ